jgi:signal transduction histidine kinase
VHDIRSPLSAVTGALDIMRMIGVTEEVEEYLSIAQEGLSHSLLLINEMLEVNRIEIGAHLIEKASIEPKSCLLECLQTAEIEARRRSITISSSVTMDSPPLPTLNADRVRFKRVIDNLLTNAIKFTPHDGTVSLDALVVSQTNGTESLEVTVADTGVGIAPEDQRTIFDPYVQAKNDRRHLGVGLGLAVVKHIVEAHGGSVRVESEPGRGTRFTVSYPI